MSHSLYWYKAEILGIFFAVLASPFGSSNSKVMNSNHCFINKADTVIFICYSLTSYFAFGSKLRNRTLFFLSMRPLISIPAKSVLHCPSCIRHTFNALSTIFSLFKSTAKTNAFAKGKIQTPPDLFFLQFINGISFTSNSTASILPCCH